MGGSGCSRSEKGHGREQVGRESMCGEEERDISRERREGKVLEND